jgi:hypothetical protein
MHRWTAALVVLAVGCDSGGSQTELPEAGTDATLDGTTTGDDGGGEPEATVEASTRPPCLDIDATLPWASVDCVYGGHCPASCAADTASAYLCQPGPDAAASYPAVFEIPSDGVDILGLQPDAYPWDAAAYLSCAPLTCTRWATADHVDGGSAWSGDPCGDGGLATQAWVCPESAGVLPTPAGCFNAGDLQRIGGTGTGIPVNVVWCCPAATGSDAGSDGGLDAGSDAGDASAE